MSKRGYSWDFHMVYVRHWKHWGTAKHSKLRDDRRPTCSTLSSAALPDCDVVSTSQAFSVAFVKAQVFTTMGELTGLGFLVAQAAANTIVISTAPERLMAS